MQEKPNFKTELTAPRSLAAGGGNLHLRQTSIQELRLAKKKKFMAEIWGNSHSMTSIVGDIAWASHWIGLRPQYHSLLIHTSMDLMEKRCRSYYYSVWLRHLTDRSTIKHGGDLSRCDCRVSNSTMEAIKVQSGLLHI